MFFKCNTEDECKKLFNKIAFKLHPDHGGDHELMILLKESYDEKVKFIRELDEHLNKKEKQETKKQKRRIYEKATDKVYSKDKRMYLLKEIYEYLKRNPKLKLDFVESVVEYYNEKKYVTSGQYNALLNIYHQYEIYKEDFKE